jgi:hypothetical protein
MERIISRGIRSGKRRARLAPAGGEAGRNGGRAHAERGVAGGGPTLEFSSGSVQGVSMRFMALCMLRNHIYAADGPTVIFRRTIISDTLSDVSGHHARLSE